MTLLAPFFLKLPAAYAQWMHVIRRQYLELSETLGLEPDATLLAPIVEAFQRLQARPPADPSNDA